MYFYRNYTEEEFCTPPLFISLEVSGDITMRPSCTLFLICATDTESRIRDASVVALCFTPLVIAREHAAHFHSNCWFRNDSESIPAVLTMTDVGRERRRKRESERLNDFTYVRGKKGAAKRMHKEYALATSTRASRDLIDAARELITR